MFLTDGKATAGVRDPSALRALAKERNVARATVFGIAFGADADWPLVYWLATDGGGKTIRIQEGGKAGADLADFLIHLTHPVLTEVRVEYGRGITARAPGTPILFGGSELLIVGTFDPALPAITGTLRANGPDGPVCVDFSETVADAPGGSFLPRLHAYEEIRHIEERISAEGETSERVEKIRSLAMRHHFVTQYTSLVLILDEPATLPPALPTMEPGIAADPAPALPASPEIKVPPPAPTPLPAPPDVQPPPPPLPPTPAGSVPVVAPPPIPLPAVEGFAPLALVGNVPDPYSVAGSHDSLSPLRLERSLQDPWVREEERRAMGVTCGTVPSAVHSPLRSSGHAEPGVEARLRGKPHMEERSEDEGRGLPRHESAPPPTPSTHKCEIVPFPHRRAEDQRTGADARPREGAPPSSWAPAPGISAPLAAITALLVRRLLRVRAS